MWDDAIALGLKGVRRLGNSVPPVDEHPALGGLRTLRVGVAVATYNSKAQVMRCLEGLRDAVELIVVYDDKSTDGTREAVLARWPDVVVLHGAGDAWWGGGTRAAVTECFRRGCDAALMLNPDVEVDAAAVAALSRFVAAHPFAIAAALVVDACSPDRIAWAGSRWRQFVPGIPLRAQAYLWRRGSSARLVGRLPYRVDEVHGRAVLVSRDVFHRIGSIDAAAFPHYGGDNDYSCRAQAAGIRMFVVPEAVARLEVAHTAMGFHGAGLVELVADVRRYLFERRYGDALRVNWLLAQRHVPCAWVLPQFVAWLAIGVAGRVRSSIVADRLGNGRET